MPATAEATSPTRTGVSAARVMVVLLQTQPSKRTILATVGYKAAGLDDFVATLFAAKVKTTHRRP